MAAPGPTPPPWRRRLRWALWIGLAGLGAGLLAAWLVLLAVLYGWGIELQRAPLAWGLSRVLRTEVVVGGLEGSVLDGLVIRDVAIGAPGPGGTGALRVGRIELELDLSRLLPEDRIAVRRLEIADVDLSVARDAGGGWRVTGLESLSEPSPEPAGEPGTGPPFEVDLDRLELRDVRVEAAWSQGDATHEALGRVDGVATDLHWPIGEAHPWPRETRAQVALRRARVAGIPIDDGRVSLSSAGPVVHFEPSWLAGPFGRLEVSGRGELSGTVRTARVAALRVEARFDDLALEELVRDEAFVARIRGRVDAEVDFPAPAPAPASDGDSLRIDFDADLGASTVRGIPLDAARVAGAYEVGSGRWRIDEARVEGSGGHIEGRGHGDRAGVGGLSLAARALRLEMVPGLPAGATGRAEIDWRLAGAWASLHGPARLELQSAAFGPASGVQLELEGEVKGDGRYRVDALQLEGELAPVLLRADGEPAPAPQPVRIESTGPLHVTRTGGELRIEDAALDTSLGRLEGDVARSGAGRLRADVRGRGIDLEAAGRLVGWPLPLGGVVGFDLDLEGTRERIAPVGRIDWQAPRVGDLTAEALTLGLERAEPEGLDARLALRLEGREMLRAELRLPRRLPLSEPAALLDAEDARIELVLDRFVPRWLAALGRGTPRRSVEGLVTGRVALDGPRTAPSLEGRLTWSDPRYGPARADAVDVQIETRDADGGARVEVALSVAEAGNRSLFATARLPVDTLVRAPAELPSDRRSELELLADRLQLSWLDGMAFGGRSPLRDLAGRLDGQARVWGGTPRPMLDGELELSGGRVSVPQLDGVFEPIQGVVAIEEGLVRIDSLQVGSGRGAANLTGQLSWSLDGFEELDLRADFQRFAVLRAPLVEAQLGGSLTLTGPADAPALEGRLALRNTRLALPEPEDPLLREVRVLQLPGEGEATSIREGRRVDPLAPARMDVALDVPRGTWVRGRGLDAQIQGELRASKQPNLPVTLSGSLEALEGTYTYAGRTFVVRRGVLSLPGGGELDPVLDIEAVYELPEVTLRVLVSGPYSELSEGGIVLESDPPLDYTDKLSYLAFGRPADQLGQSERTKLSDTATQVLGHLLLDLMGSRVAETFAIDRVEVNRAPDGEGTEVELEKRVGDQIIVRYGRSLREGAGDRVEIEYRLNRQWSFQSDVSNSGDSGVDLIWTYDY